MNKLLLLCVFFLLGGCTTLFPYEDEFACKRPDNLGKCISSVEAYEQIKNGDDSSPYIRPASETDDEDENKNKPNKNKNDSKMNISESRKGYERYLDANYKEQAELVEKPITPLVNSAEVIEMLVLSYPTDNGKRLKGERYINVINNNPKFILGDYLKKKPIAIESLFDK